MPVDSNVVIITGGSRGIGAATARVAARRGWNVALSYRGRADAAAEVAAECRGFGVSAMVVAADVSIEADVLRLFDTVEAELGRPTGLVNNAGIVAPQSRVEDLTIERIERMLAVNVVGAFLCAREAVRRIPDDCSGVIVNVSSRAAVLGSPGEYVDYAASKAAVDTLTVGLAKEVAARGLRVVGVRPGLIDTEIHASSGEPGRVERLKDTVPMGRAGTAEEVAEAIGWLLSPEASFVTGTTLDVSGGR